MIEKHIFKTFCVYLTSVCMLGSGLHWAFFFTLVGQMAAFDVYAVDDLKKELDSKYQLNTPKNVDGNNLFNKIMTNKDKGSPSSGNVENEVLSRPAGVGTSLDFSGYQDIDFHDEFKRYMGEGIPQGAPKAPSMTNGDIDVEYYEKAGVKFNRDDNGKLVTETIVASERGAKSTSIKASEAFTNQQSRPDEEFNAPGNYGNESDYIDDLKVQYGKTSDGKTMSSEAYRAIMKGAEVNPAPRIKSNTYFLENTNKAINDAQLGKGIWSQSCVDQTTTETEQKQMPIWEPAICVQPNHQNLDHCEVTRTLELNPGYIENITPQYIEKFVQKPEGCADKIGWKPICPDEECKQVAKRITTESPLLLAQSRNRIKADLLDTFRYLDNPIQNTSGNKTKVQATVKIEHWGGDSTGLPRFKPVVGYLHVIDGQEWRVLSCERTTYEYSTCLVEMLEQIPCDAEPGVEFIYQTEYISPKDSIDSIRYAGQYGITYVILKDDLQYELSNCRSLGSIPHGSVWECKASPRKSESCKSDICPIIPACMEYIPSVEINPFCTFDKWEVIEQSTQNYTQQVISKLSRMFEGDPNPEHIYDAKSDGTGGYRVGTWKINAKGYSCDPLKGNKYCAAVFNSETNEFEEKCYKYNELKETKGSCEKFKQNPRCEKTGSSCAEGWLDDSTGICYMYSDDYRCDVSNPVVITKTTTTNVCASMLPCMGNDCAYGQEEKSDDFEKAVLMASIAQSVEDDAACATTDPSTCEIFPGKSEYCSWEVSGMGNNCCEAPSGINYLEMAAMGYKMMQTETFKNVSSTLSGGVTDQIGGLYTDFTSMLVDGWNSGATAVVDFASSMMGDPEFMQGAVDAITVGGETTADGIVSSLMHQMQQQLYNFLNDLLPDALADMLFEEATAEMVDQGVAQAGDVVLSEAANTFLSILSFVGLIYTIYNVVKILANLLTQCDKNEQDMGVKLAQKQCFAVGGKYCAEKVLGVCYLRRQDWCCYSSMLSRIIADQGSKQLGKDMASCPGFTIEEFGRIDFDRLDLSEWLSTMYQADILSTSGYDIERLTGDGRMYGNLSCDDGDPNCIEMNRKNADERALEQFGGDADGAANQLRDTFDPSQIDCSVYPRPMICELEGN